MLPVPKEQAEAIQKTAEFGTAAVKEVGDLCRYGGKILGTAPEDLVGIFLGEPLRLVRAAVAAKVDEKIEEIHRARNVQEKIAVSPSIAIPLMQAAWNESRPELQDLWARLIAAAMDPSRENRVRKSFIETLKKLDPSDALILKRRYENSGELSPNAQDYMASFCKLSRLEVQVSVDNLVELKCCGRNNHAPVNFFITAYGSELIRACSD